MQFDVYNSPLRDRRRVPFVVSLQSDRLDYVRTRLVAALIESPAIKTHDPNIAPTLRIGGVTVVLDVFNLAVVPVERLGPAVASLADEDSRAKLVRAMDELLSQA